MRTPHPAEPIEVRPEPPGGWLTSCVRAWDRFWFRPADPLPLGVIRVFAGAVILYVHLIYSLDLQAMVGKDAWVTTDREPLVRSRLDPEGHEESAWPISYFREDFPFFPPLKEWLPKETPRPMARGIPEIGRAHV